MTFSAPLPAADATAGHRVCVTFRAARACLHGTGGRVAQRTPRRVGDRRTASAFAARATTSRCARARRELGVRARPHGALDGEQRGTPADAERNAAHAPLPPAGHRRLDDPGRRQHVVATASAAPSRHQRGAHLDRDLARSFGLNWVRHAAAQARTRSIRTRRSCGSGPTRAFRSAQHAAAAPPGSGLRRAGAGDDALLSPRRPRGRLLADAADPAQRRPGARAARGQPGDRARPRTAGSGVHVIDMRKVFTPHNRFQQTGVLPRALLRRAPARRRAPQHRRARAWPRTSSPAGCAPTAAIRG